MPRLVLGVPSAASQIGGDEACAVRTTDGRHVARGTMLGLLSVGLLSLALRFDFGFNDVGSSCDLVGDGSEERWSSQKWS